MREKLKSRKFWITIIVIAVAVLKGLQESGASGSQIVEGICMVCACVAAVAYVFAEALLDKEDETVIETEGETAPKDENDTEATEWA